jgi:hypothetical protein
MDDVNVIRILVQLIPDFSGLIKIPPERFNQQVHNAK